VTNISENMDQIQMQSNQYHKACIVITGDNLDEWKHLIRELKMRVNCQKNFQKRNRQNFRVSLFVRSSNNRMAHSNKKKIKGMLCTAVQCECDRERQFLRKQNETVCVIVMIKV
jgi:hypothetical protein